MITQITKIKNLGIFDDYASADLEYFNKFNLIYGLNGTGKTTLSELFTAFNSGKLAEYPDLEYQFKSNRQTYSQNEPYDKGIRVFNQRYIADNMDIIAGNARSIIILGKENKDLIKVIQQDEKILNGDPEKKNNLGKIQELSLKEQELDAKKQEKNKEFTDVARIISANTNGVTARRYDKRNAEDAFNELKNKALLSEEEFNQNKTTLQQQQQKSIFSPINADNIKNVEQINLESASILNQTVKTIIIDRLKEHADISQWVEQGIDLHEKNKSTTCEFCNQPLPKNRIPDLLSYFNDADKDLKSDIDSLLGGIKALYSSIDKLTFLDKANLYDEFQEDYTNAIKKVEHHKTALLSAIEEFSKVIKDKKQHTTEQLRLTIKIDATAFIDAITSANLFIKECNTKTYDFNEVKEIAKNKLETHYLSEIYDYIKQLTEDIDKLKTEILYLNNGDPSQDGDIGINDIKKRISDNKKKIFSSDTACKEINEQLKTFLGRDEIIFEVTEGGYEIKRKGKPAKNLSEGEKTAITFVYFTIHLKDKEFDLKNGIVVIDDPVSSMDSNSIYQAFAFLKNAVKDAQQVFILTHNFSFLKLLLNWLNWWKNEKKSEYYMIKNSYDANNNRIVTLEDLDGLLIDYKTEYQYLFKLLFNLESDGTIASVYPIPNIARKTLESFLEFRVPNNESMSTKMKKLKFDEKKKDAILKFTNDQSHITGSGFNPALVPECQNNVKYLLEMIEQVFPEHYKILIACHK